MFVYTLSEAAEKNYRGAGYALAAVDDRAREVVSFVYAEDILGDIPEGIVEMRALVNTAAFKREAAYLGRMGFVCVGMLSGRTFTEL